MSETTTTSTTTKTTLNFSMNPMNDLPLRLHRSEIVTPSPIFSQNTVDCLPSLLFTRVSFSFSICSLEIKSRYANARWHVLNTLREFIFPGKCKCDLNKYMGTKLSDQISILTVWQTWVRARTELIRLTSPRRQYRRFPSYSGGFLLIDVFPSKEPPGQVV